MKEIKVFILNGFLGSGKTTLLKKMLNNFEEQKVAIIMNEFGKHDVDGILIADESINLKTVHNGSIFCSCKSDKFVEAMLILIKEEPDVIIVESSGLANPATMPKILETVKKLAGDQLSLAGSIGIFDATNIYKLIQTAYMTKQQIATSSVIILNKIDLATEEQIEKSIKAITEYNDMVPIIKASFCDLPFEVLDRHLRETNFLKNKRPVNQHTLGIQNILIDLPDKVNKEKLMAWLDTFKDEIYRLKGFFKDEASNQYLVEVINEQIIIQQKDIKTEDFLIVFAPPSSDFKNKIISRAKEVLDINIVLK